MENVQVWEESKQTHQKRHTIVSTLARAAGERRKLKYLSEYSTVR